MIDIISSRILVMCNVTNDCNQTCIHCLADAKCGIKTELKYEHIKRLITSLNQINQDFTISFVGGEATIWSDFYKMLDSNIFKDITWKMLYTNATALNDARISAIKEANFYEVRVSVDSDRKEEHDDLRGLGTFDRTLKSIKMMVEVGVPVSVAAVLKQNNVDRIPKLVSFMKSVGVKIMHLVPLYMTGRGILAKEYAIDIDKQMEIREKLKNQYPNLCEIRTPLCANGTAFIKIECNGNCYIQKGRDKNLIGNIIIDDFADIFLKTNQLYTPSIVDCKACPYYAYPILCQNMYSYCLTEFRLNTIE